MIDQIENPTCACGCKGKVSFYRGKWRMFLPHHHTKMRKDKEKHSLRMKGNLLFLHKKHSESTKKIMSKNQKGKNNSCWRGGRTISGGYVFIYMPEHPFCNRNRRVKEERLVVENHIGRYLTREEIVHHKNRKKTDNSLDNLQIVTQPEHQKIHWETRSRFVSDITKQKMSLSHKGIPLSEEHKRKIGDSRRGKPIKPHTEVFRQKQREIHLGKHHSLETRKKMKISAIKGWIKRRVHAKND